MCPTKALQTEYAVTARASRPGPLPFVLKEAETFAIFDSAGDVRSDDGSELGIFHEGMRYVSRLELKLWDLRPLVLSSEVREDNCLYTAHLTNPDLEDLGEREIGKGTLYVQRSSVLSAAACAQRIRISNYADVPMEVPVSVSVAADFRDIFEVRGMERRRRGRLHPPQRESDGLRIAYAGLDGHDRMTCVAVGPCDVTCEGDTIRALAHIAPRSTVELFVGLSFECAAAGPQITFNDARNRSFARYKSARSNAAQIHTNNEHVNVWLNRSFADMHLLASETKQGLYPYAGIPWFCCPFGRDGLITARECLTIEPSLTRGVLAFLAEVQATEEDPERDAEPGKIIHEMRLGEMAATGEIPFGRYYGSVDSTPLFVMLAGDYFRRTGDVAFMREIWPNIERALQWIDEWGDLDGDGFVEYERHSSNGLVNQGWKDSHDSIFHADGTDAVGAIALCEVQGYVYAARKAAAEIATALGMPKAASDLSEKADQLRTRFERSFWCESIGSFAMALDGEKEPCRVISSNAGHSLFSGIASDDHALRVVQSLTADGSFSGWGVRTVDMSAARYNPMSYHNGSIWPHDNALIALGCARYGFKEAVLKITTGLFDAAMFMSMHRLPELFCGFARQPEEGPTMYPVACLPQAWASGAVFALLEACLGLSVIITKDGRPQVRLDNPALPPFIEEIEIRNLTVGQDSIDMAWHRYEGDVATNILKRPTGVEVVVRK